MLRNLNTSSGGRRILGTPYVGGLASEIPTGFPLPALLANDTAGDPAGTRYRVEILTWPSAGTLKVNEDSSFSFTGAPDGTYTGSERVWKYSSSAGTYEDTTYSFTIGSGALVGAPSTQTNISGTGALGLTHALAGAVSTQTSQSGTGVAHLVHALVGAPSTQSNFSSSAAISPAFDPRYARPQSDVSAGTWTPSTGTSLAACIDEPAADAADYITANSPGTCEIKLGPVADPATSSGQVVRYQIWGDAGSSLLVQLTCGATLIAAWNHATMPTTPTIIAQTLSPSECDAITDYADLRLVFTAG